MYKYAFFYNYNNLKDLIEDACQYKFEINHNQPYLFETIINSDNTEDIIFFHQEDTIKIRFIPEKLIFVVFINKVKYLGNLKFLNRYTPLNITTIINNNSFQKKLVKNLTKIVLELSTSYEKEHFELIGNYLSDSIYLEGIDYLNNNSNLIIQEYIFQPPGYKHTIKIKNPNRLEFNSKIHDTEKEIFFNNFLTYIKEVK